MGLRNVSLRTDTGLLPMWAGAVLFTAYGVVIALDDARLGVATRRGLEALRGGALFEWLSLPAGVAWLSPSSCAGRRTIWVGRMVSSPAQ